VFFQTVQYDSAGGHTSRHEYLNVYTTQNTTSFPYRPASRFRIRIDISFFFF
jgi:hypothetical protein